MAKQQSLMHHGYNKFISVEALGGVVLFILSILAMVIANSPLAHVYQEVLAAKLTVGFDGMQISKPLIMWINDGLMTAFFFLVGLEVKRELIEGELNSVSKASLPALAAVGGMVFPALIYVYFNHHHPLQLRGWAIPTATDIAFALGIVALLGKRVPLSLKVFLTALAIFDDIGAIIIIAIFYTAQISLFSLLMASICLLVLMFMNRFNVCRIAPYILVGFVLWLFVLKSGVHATLAGVALALFIPIKNKANMDVSPLNTLEEALNPWVAFLVLPIFAFANAGVSLTGMHWHTLMTTIPLGIILGLFVGKQAGVMLTTWLGVKCFGINMPSRSTWAGIYGISLICGVGFTMSLFIGGLAFGKIPGDYMILVKVGVLAGSLLSGILGYLLLRMTHKQLA